MAEAVPIGTIVAYAGTIFGPEEEESSGWMLCDGRLMNANNPAHLGLFNALGFSWGGDGAARFNIPDLRGYFLRGFDARQDANNKDPESSTRTANLPGGATGHAVGAVQDHATAVPRSPDHFWTDFAGAHKHSINFETNASRDVAEEQFNTVAAPNIGGYHPQTDESAGHRHGIVGGNRETRPINASVNWIIRAQ